MTTSNKHPGAPWRNFYGRVKGKTLKASQEAYLEEDLGALSPGPVDWDVNPDRVPLDTGRLFDGKPLWLEVGFGGGEHMVHQAAQNPQVGIVGCEPYINGVAMLLGKIRRAGVGNVRVYPGDVRNLFDVLPDGCIERAFLLYPDPWPKKRQQKRRLIQPDFLDSLHRACRTGAKVRFATDVTSYADEALWRFLQHGGYNWLAGAADDWRRPPADHVTTRYETKRLGDCDPVWYDFEIV